MKLKISTTLLFELEKLNKENIKEELKDRYTFEKNENGLIVATKDKRLIHSKYSIEAEAKNALKNIDKNTKAVIFFGLGLSYVLKYFIENIDSYEVRKDIKIIVVVNDIYLFDYFYNNISTSIFESENIFFVSINDNFDFVFSMLANNNIFNFKFIVLQSLKNEEKEIAMQYQNKILSMVQIFIADIFTRLNFENLWIKNIIFNSLYLKESSDISALKHSAKKFNALLVSAGPTLENSIKEIKENRDSFIIIAVDTAYSILSKNNIDPDFVITADAGFYNSYDFIYEQKGFSFLVMDLITNKKIPSIVKNKTNIFTFSSTKSLSIVGDIENKLNTKISELFLGSTVATAMIDFAYFLGFEKVLLVGFDNSYPYYYRHSKHALSYEYKINNTTKLETMESYYFDTIKESSNIYNYPPTSYVLNNQIEYLKNMNYENMKIMRLKSNAIDLENISDGSIKDIVVSGSRKEAMFIFNKLYKKNSIDNETIKKYYEYISINLLEFNNNLYKLYNELITDKNNREIIENKIEILINEYIKKLPIVENILNTVITISKLKNSDIMFIITEAIKTINYFSTRVNIILGSF